MLGDKLRIPYSPSNPGTCKCCGMFFDALLVERVCPVCAEDELALVYMEIKFQNERTARRESRMVGKSHNRPTMPK